MRQPARPNPQKAPRSVGVNLPPPTGGWNARDSLAAMSPTDAPILDNWVPRAGFVELRRGYAPQVIGFSAPIEALLPYRAGSGGDKLYAASAGGLYDVSTKGATLGAPVASGYASNRWNYTSFATTSGQWTIACNGVDAPIGCNNGSWGAVPTLSSTGSPVLDPTKLFNVFGHKGRLYYLQANSLYVWCPAAFAIGGACTVLDLSSIFSKGGRLVCGGTWSGQYGLLSDDFAIFVTDQGQVAVYQGTDPTQASTWSLVGVFDLGVPLGPRAVIKFGGDLALVTTDGVVPLSQAIRLDRAQQESVALTNKIINAFSAAVKSYQGNFGWSAVLYPGASNSTLLPAAGGSLAIFNIPVTELGVSMQFVQNVLTGAWARFLNIAAYCWEVAGGNVYFGGATGVYQWDQGSSDNGVPIVAEVQGAFSGYSHPGRLKQFHSIRPILNATAIVQPALDINVDYQSSVPTAVPTVVDQTTTEAAIRYDWTSASGLGVVGAPVMAINLIGEASKDTLATDLTGDELAVDVPPNDTLAIYSNLPFDVPCQLLGWNILYTPGGLLG